MKDAVGTLHRLQEWYHSHCDGVWEHSNGISVTTLDNPGWGLIVDIRETRLAAKPFPEYTRNYDDDVDWLICVLKDGEFHGHCGPLLLEEMIEVFLSWAHEP